MNLNKIPVKNKRLFIPRSVEEGELIIFIKGDVAYLLQDSWAVVWRLINGRRTISEIILKVSELYNGNEEKIKKYTIETINRLKEINAISMR